MLESVRTRGAALETARAAVILVHGRGATADSILTLADAVDTPEVAYLAPQAPHFAWYPYSFLAPTAQNEPDLSNALHLLDGLAEQVIQAGLASQQVALLGFSQGACLALEYTARTPRRYGAVIGFSGGLIGPPGTPRDYPGSLEGTPVFIGCSDVDPHIPKERVLETAQVLERMGAQVTARLYPGMGHSVNDEEIGFMRAMIAGMVEGR